MAQSKILVDTNSYLRLAKTIHPLLFSPFGENEYCLYIIPELNDELEGSRLQTKFSWVLEEEFSGNRRVFPTVSKAQNKAIRQTFEFVWEATSGNYPGPSRVDVLYIAYAIELDLPLVTDDEAMIELALEFEVRAMKTLELVKLMHDVEHISEDQIKSLVAYWKYNKDMPAKFKKDFKRLFKF